MQAASEVAGFQGGAVAAEGLTWLWPDLDQLADADDAEVAHHAREALEQLREDALDGV